jgi:hypothetical protein
LRMSQPTITPENKAINIHAFNIFILQSPSK